MDRKAIELSLPHGNLRWFDSQPREDQIMLLGYLRGKAAIEAKKAAADDSDLRWYGR